MTEGLDHGLPPHDHGARRERLRDSLAGRWLLVSHPVNVRYLTGFTGTAGSVLVGPSAEHDRLLTDSRYTERAAREAGDLPLELTRTPQEVATELVREVGDDGAETPVLGIEADHVTWVQAREAQRLTEAAGVRLLGVTGAVSQLRTVKDDAELARLQRANDITASALEWLFTEHVRPGVSERELAITLERRFIDLGADGVAFSSIVASGHNTVSPHHDPGGRQLRPGDLLTIDAGARVDGYHADHTRTVGIGHLGEQARRIHEVVRVAQQAGREAAVEDALTGDVDAAARGVIEEAGYGRWFVHGTGHGVGLEIHEAPSVAKGGTATLAVGTTLTVEPGVYVPGIGGVRIEDSHVIVPDGPARAFTDASRELVIL